MDYISNLELLPPETIFNILLRLPASDILRFCRVSRTLREFCNNSNFWAAKAKRDFDISRGFFEATQVEDPRQKYIQLLNGFLNLAAGAGDVDQIIYLLSLRPTDLNTALRNAAFAGHLDVVKILLNNGGNDLDGALIAASEGKDLATVRYLVNAGATDIDEALTAASYSGTQEIVDYLSNVSMGEVGLS